MVVSGCWGKGRTSSSPSPFYPLFSNPSPFQVLPNRLKEASAKRGKVTDPKVGAKNGSAGSVNEGKVVTSLNKGGRGRTLVQERLEEEGDGCLNEDGHVVVLLWPVV